MFGKKKNNNNDGGNVKREIVINAEHLETRVSVLENGRLEEFQIEHPSEERIVGSIYKGKIQNLEDELQAAFVDIGLKKNAFLHYWDMIPDDAARLEAEEGISSGRSRRKRVSNEEIAKLFPIGSDIVVQVTKGPISTKGPRVTASLSVPGRFLVMMPGSNLRGVSRKIDDEKERQRLKKILARLPAPENIGLIVRTVGEGAKKTSFVRDLRALTATWDELQRRMREEPSPCCLYREPDLVERVVRDYLTMDVDRISVDNKQVFDRIRDVASLVSRKVRSRIQYYQGDAPIFEHFQIHRQIKEAFRRKVLLDCGGYIIVEETEALISVDVNTGRYKGSGSQEEAILEVNTEAVKEVARQLRLRNLGGLIVIDLIDMKQRKHQNAVYKSLRQALRGDRSRTNVLPISPLGLIEMTRQRADEGIHSTMYVDCPYCHGAGSVKSSLSMSVEIQRQVSAVMRRQQHKKASGTLLITVHPTVLQRLRREDEKVLIELENKYKGHLSFRSDPNRHLEDFTISNADDDSILYSSKE
jgi:ribonuclease G